MYAPQTCIGDGTKAVNHHADRKPHLLCPFLFGKLSNNMLKPLNSPAELVLFFVLTVPHHCSSPAAAFAPHHNYQLTAYNGKRHPSSETAGGRRSPSDDPIDKY